MCEDYQLEFTKTFFKARETQSFTVSAHHELIAHTLDRVITGEIKRLIINIPPGYTKTEMAVIAFIARGFAINPRSKFIHVSFSDKLVKENSRKIQDTMKTEPYRDMWGVDFRKDSSAKDVWNTSAGGGLLAVTGKGTVTGFRAGLLPNDEDDPWTFTGAMIIDDPLKPDDARYPVEREAVNDRFHNTFKSRPIHPEDIPIIVIMQRLHRDDMCGHLLMGGTGEKWHHLMLPVEIKKPTRDKETGAIVGGYPAAWTHGIPIEHNLPEGPLWRQVHDEAAIQKLKLKNYVYAGQYKQRPTAAGGTIFKEQHLVHRYRPGDEPHCEFRMIYADTAQKTAEANDYSVFQLWGKTRDGKAVLLDQVRGKWEAPELQRIAEKFWKKHRDTKRYPHNRWGSLRKFKVEDKVSGTGLIQGLKRKKIAVFGIPREKDKLTRGLDVVPEFEIGNVVFPIDVPWWADYEEEILSFTGLGDTHDDQVDPTMDAVSELLVTRPSMMDVV